MTTPFAAGRDASLTGALRDKARRLAQILQSFTRVAVALSGGVDSSCLLAAAVETLGAERVVALTAESPLLAPRDLDYATRVAAQLGVRHVRVPFDELTIPEVAANGPRRCYFCKHARFAALQRLLSEAGDAVLLHGENADDTLDYRPGSQAARELGVRAPLAEAQLSKAEIRQLAERHGLPNWSAPADACLATRFPTNTPLTAESLLRVRQAESIAHALMGDVQLRVRDHFPIARLELAPEDLPRALEDDLRTALVDQLKSAGYRYVTLDLAGYTRGSQNDPESVR